MTFKTQLMKLTLKTKKGEKTEVWSIIVFTVMFWNQGFQLVYNLVFKKYTYKDKLKRHIIIKSSLGASLAVGG